MRSVSRSLLVLPAFLVWATTTQAQDRLIRDFHVARACVGDIVNLCSNVLPGGGRLKACVKDNMSKLSADCVDAMLTAAAAARETPKASQRFHSGFQASTASISMNVANASFSHNPFHQDMVTRSPNHI
mgnify:CR=1 FL=1